MMKVALDSLIMILQVANNNRSGYQIKVALLQEVAGIMPPRGALSNRED